VGGGVLFVKWGEGTMVVGVGRSGGYFLLRGVRVSLDALSVIQLISVE